jgi:hypothetical protein
VQPLPRQSKLTSTLRPVCTSAIRYLAAAPGCSRRSHLGPATRLLTNAGQTPPAAGARVHPSTDRSTRGKVRKLTADTALARCIRSREAGRFESGMADPSSMTDWEDDPRGCGKRHGASVRSRCSRRWVGDWYPPQVAGLLDLTSCRLRRRLANIFVGSRIPSPITRARQNDGNFVVRTSRPALNRPGFCKCARHFCVDLKYLKSGGA